MSRDFIKKGIGSSQIAQAIRQQKEIRCLIESSTQSEITQSYIEAWVNRQEYSGSPDYFVNYMKSILKTDNFMSAFQQLRYPLPSAQLVHDKIKIELGRVFDANDAFFNYTIQNEVVEQPTELNSKDFNAELYNAIFFRYNDLVLTEMEGINMPTREILSIDNIKAIECYEGEIYRVAYCSVLNDQPGYSYVDSEMFAFYPKDEKKEAVEFTHDLGRCPVQFIVNDSFTNTSVVKKSIFSFIKTDLEEYNLLKTFRKMLDVNGTFPVVTVFKNRDSKANTNSHKGSSPKEPKIESKIPMASGLETQTNNKGSLIQAGTQIKVPAPKKDAGGIDMDMVKNYINYFYAPVDVLEFIDQRIKDTKAHIISAIVGDYSEMSQKEESKNQMQVGKSYISKEDRLRYLSRILSRVSMRSEYDFLGLMYGPGSISVDLSFGLDFFLATTDQIYDLIKKSPNPIESRELLMRASGGQKRSNSDKHKKTMIQYHLLPYVNSDDFDKAINNNKVGDITFHLQTRFNYWIGMFEAIYGDILVFWNNIDGSDSDRMIQISNLLTQIIKTNVERVETNTDRTTD